MTMDRSDTMIKEVKAENELMTSDAPQTIANLSSEIEKTVQLSEQDQHRIDEIVAKIDLIDPALSTSYGAKALNKGSQFADTMLEQARAKDSAEIGEQLLELRFKVKGFDVSGLNKRSKLAGIPVIGKLFDNTEKTIASFDSLKQQIDVISDELDGGMVKLLRDVEMLEQLYQNNKASFHELTLYIAAGKRKLNLVTKEELPQAKRLAEEAPDSMAAQAVRDLVERIQRFERRLHDLELARMSALQTAPQIRILQSGNQMLAEKIQTSMLTMIPMWKNQMVLGLAIKSQKNAALVQKEIADTTNELLRRNAEMLEQSSIETAREVERSIIDVDTLKEVQQRLINTIDETMNIATQAREHRAEVEKELETMEQQLHDRLLQAAERQKREKMDAVTESKTQQ